MSEAPSEDCAWVTIPAPFGADELRQWLEDPETLFRINSLLEIGQWIRQGERQARCVGRNLSNDRELELAMTLDPGQQGLLITYTGGLKRSTTFTVEPGDTTTSQLRITDDYSGLSEDERKARVGEVDRSLPQWGRDLHKYFHAWKRWSWFPPWRWYMTHLWLKMKPTARRITRWIWWLTLAEIVAFALVFGVLLIEQR
ncbi:MAG: hypothetical protein KDI74_08960 [Gammaproteobacteria bacterium]|nr:hypothetical protein [Gammaproteobacteria bacterium]